MYLLHEDLETAKAAFFHLIGYAPQHEAVAAYHRSTARIRVIEAPARTSKSYSAAHEHGFDLLPLYDRRRRRPYLEPPHSPRLSWVVGIDYDSMKEFDYLYDLFVRRRSAMPIPYQIEREANSPRQGDREIVLDWGRGPDGHRVRTMLKGKSGAPSVANKLESEEVWSAIVSETAEHAPQIWHHHLATRVHHATWPTTPKVKARWILEEMEAARTRPSVSLEVFHYPPEANPHYNWQRYRDEEAKAESRQGVGRAHADPYFAEQFLGLWCNAADAVLPFRDRAGPTGPSHVIDELPATWRIGAHYISVDYGHSDAAVALFWSVLHDRQVVLLSEIYERGLTTPAFADAVAARAETLGLHTRFATGDPKRPEVNQLLAERGLPVASVDEAFQRSRAASGMMLVDALSTDPATGRPGLVVLSPRCLEGPPFGCARTIHEWTHLRRKEQFAGDEWSPGAIVGDDHAFDAARAFLASRPRGVALRSVEMERFERDRRAIVRAQRRARRLRVAGRAAWAPGMEA